MDKRERQVRRAKEWQAWLSDTVDSPRSVSPSQKLQNRRTIQDTLSPSANRRQMNARIGAHARESNQPVKDRSLGLNADMFRGVAAGSSGAQGVANRSKKTKPNKAIFPKISIPENFNWKKVVKVMLPVVIIATLISISPYILRTLSTQKKEAAVAVSNEPTYAPIEPQKTGGQVRGVQYDPEKKLYKFNDTYGGVELTVSQQPLPDDLRANPEKVKTLAGGIGSNEMVETTIGNAYISTDEKLTTQRIVFATRHLLVFIQADGILKGVDWVNYIQSLES